MVELHVDTYDSDAAQGLIEAWNEEIQAKDPAFDPTVGAVAKPDDFNPPFGRFLIARLEGDAVGCGGVRRLDETTAELKRLYVLPGHRSQGIGVRLLTELEQAARDLGYARLRLDTDGGDPAAVELFRTHGFREIPDYNANPMATLWFERDLAERARASPRARPGAG